MNPTEHTHASYVAQIFIAFFNRAPEFGALQYYTARLDALALALGPGATSGDSLKALAREIYFAGSINGEVPAGPDYTDAHYVRDLYQNVLGRSAADDPEGWAHWVKALADGEVAREDMLETLLFHARDDERDGAYLANRTAVALEFAREDRSGPEVFERLSVNAAEILRGVNENPDTVLQALAVLDQAVSVPGEPPLTPTEPGMPPDVTVPGPAPSPGPNPNPSPNPNPNPNPEAPAVLTLAQAMDAWELPERYMIDPSVVWKQDMQAVNGVWIAWQQVQAVLEGAENSDELDMAALFKWGILDTYVNIAAAAGRDEFRSLLNDATHVYVTEPTVNWAAYQLLSQFSGFDLGPTEIWYPTLTASYLNYYGWSDEKGPYYIQEGYRDVLGFQLEGLLEKLGVIDQFLAKALNADAFKTEDVYGWEVHDGLEALLIAAQDSELSVVLARADAVYVDLPNSYIRLPDYEILSSLENFKLESWQYVLPFFQSNDSGELSVDLRDYYREYVAIASVEGGDSYAFKVSNENYSGEELASWISMMRVTPEGSWGSLGYYPRIDANGNVYIAFDPDFSGEALISLYFYDLAPVDARSIQLDLVYFSDIEVGDDPPPPPGGDIYLDLVKTEYIGSDQHNDRFFAEIIDGQQTLRDGVVIDGGEGDDVLTAYLLPKEIGEAWVAPEIRNVEDLIFRVDATGNVVGVDFSNVSGASQVSLDGGWNYYANSYQFINVGDIEEFIFGSEAFYYGDGSLLIDGLQTESLVLSFDYGYLAQNIVLEAGQGSSLDYLSLYNTYSNGRLLFGRPESNQANQVRALHIESDGASVSFGNYPNEFSSYFNIETIKLVATGGLSLGVVHLGNGYSTVADVDNRPFKLLDAAESTGAVYLDVMLDAARDEHEPWEILLGSGDDTVNVLNSRVNGLALPPEGSLLSGGAGTDTLIIKAEVYDHWQSEGEDRASIEDFENLTISGPVANNATVSSLLFGQAFDLVRVSLASGTSVSINQQGEGTFLVNSAESGSIFIQSEDVSNLGYVAAWGSLGYYYYDRYMYSPDYYSNFFLGVSTDLNFLNLGAVEVPWDSAYVGYRIVDSTNLQEINFSGLPGIESYGDYNGFSKIAAILEGVAVESINASDVHVILLNMIGNQSGAVVQLPDYFDVSGSSHSDVFSVNMLSATDNQARHSMPYDDPIVGRIIRNFDQEDQLQIADGSIQSVQELSFTPPAGAGIQDIMVEALGLLTANTAGWFEHDGHSYVVGKGDAYSQAEYQGVQHYKDILFVKLEGYLDLSLDQFGGLVV